MVADNYSSPFSVHNILRGPPIWEYLVIRIMFQIQKYRQTVFVNNQFRSVIQCAVDFLSVELPPLTYLRVVHTDHMFV